MRCWFIALCVCSLGCSFDGSDPGGSPDGGLSDGSPDGAVGLADAAADAASPIDPEARLTDAVGDGSDPAVAFGSSVFAIVWSDDRSGADQIHIARVGTDGAPVAAEVALTVDPADSRRPAVAWTGTRFGIVWDDGRDGNREIYFAAVGEDGAVAAGPRRVTNDGNSSQRPSLVWTGTEFGLSWTDDRDGNDEIYFARLDADGVVIGSPTRVTDDGETSERSAVAWNGTDFGVAWTDDRDGDEEILFARLDGAGAKQGGDTVVTTTLTRSERPAIATTGTTFALLWQDQRHGAREVYGARVDAVGSVTGAEVRLTNAAGDSNEPAITARGPGFAMAWADGRNGGDDTYLQPLDGTLASLAPAERTTDLAVANTVDIAVAGNVALVVWSDDRDPNNAEIYSQRILLPAP